MKIQEYVSYKELVDAFTVDGVTYYQYVKQFFTNRQYVKSIGVQSDFHQLVKLGRIKPNENE